MHSEQQTVTIILEHSPSDHPWQAFRWQLLGVLPAEKVNTSTAPELIHEEGGTRIHRLTGLKMHLYQDSCQSYLENLTAQSAKCFVAMAPSEHDRMPTPILASACAFEAEAWAGEEGEVLTAPLSAGLYQWVEKFVVNYAIPEQNHKRKRDDWKQDRKE